MWDENRESFLWTPYNQRKNLWCYIYQYDFMNGI